MSVASLVRLFRESWRFHFRQNPALSPWHQKPIGDSVSVSSLLRAPAVCELPPGRWSRHSGAPSVVAKSRQPAAETRERSSVEQPVRAPPPWTRSAKATSHERAAHEKPASRTWRSSCAEPRRAAAGNPWPMMSCCCACSSDSPEAASRWSPLLTCCWSNRSIEGAAMQVGASEIGRAHV